MGLGTFIEELISEAQHECRAWSGDSPYLAAHLRRSRQWHRKAVARGVRGELLLDQSAIKQHRLQEEISSRTDVNIVVKLAPRLTGRGVLVDRRIAGLSDLSGGAYHVVDDPILAGAIEAYLDLLRDVGALATPSLPPSECHDSAAVLKTLLEGLSDEQAARRLHMSVRSYHRRVACLNKMIGAPGRFSLGFHVAKRGIM